MTDRFPTAFQNLISITRKNQSKLSHHHHQSPPSHLITPHTWSSIPPISFVHQQPNLLSTPTSGSLQATSRNLQKYLQIVPLPHLQLTHPTMFLQRSAIAAARRAAVSPVMRRSFTSSIIRSMFILVCCIPKTIRPRVRKSLGLKLEKKMDCERMVWETHGLIVMVRRSRTTGRIERPKD